MSILTNFPAFITRYAILNEVLLYSVCCFGDYIITRESDNLPVRALTDSVTHGLVGFLSWAIVIDLSPFSISERPLALGQCIVCMMLAMFVDVDHFIAAGSTSLKDAVSLPKRPFFHITTVIIPISTILWTLGDVYKSIHLNSLCLIFIVAWFSHHIRDATRRGLLLSPFGSSPPLPHPVYIGIILFLPVLFRVCLLLSKSEIVEKSQNT